MVAAAFNDCGSHISLTLCFEVAASFSAGTVISGVLSQTVA